MLRITDARSGETVEAAPVRRRLTRVEAHVPERGTGALRVLLVADLLARTLELGGTPVWSVLTGDADPREVQADGAALGVRPSEDSRDVGRGLGEAQIVHVIAADGGPTPDGVRVTVAPGGPVDLTGADPTVIRLALLATPRDTPVRLDPATLDEARDTLLRWRRAVASWAASPSRPVPESLRGRLRDAWENDLDVPEVLRILASVETASGGVDGARFETFAYADRLLGLDLTLALGSGT
ncbi:hypothetical protein ACIQOU_35090 [Streptomyces sp. NPDC091279]|uniref:hypothetical protein n=1 Tax=Streptomyces sp. NPDC091279 TaxID=3365983 RepID=UPI003817D3D9